MDITAEMVRELRKKAGIGAFDAKEALEVSDGELDAAIDWLKAKGLLETRETKVQMSSLPGNRIVYNSGDTITISTKEAEGIAAIWHDSVADDIEDDLVSAGSVKVPDVKSLRAEMNLSQSAFAEQFGLSLTALQNWEQRRRTPDKSARILIRLIAANPELVAQIAAEETS